MGTYFAGIDETASLYVVVSLVVFLCVCVVRSSSIVIMTNRVARFFWGFFFLLWSRTGSIYLRVVDLIVEYIVMVHYETVRH